MPASLTLPKYSIGVGDRFAHQAKAQLQACIDAAGEGVDVIPVWNKSNREPAIVGSEPLSRPQVTAKVWEHIKANNLQNPANKREILADAHRDTCQHPDQQNHDADAHHQ